MMNKGTILTAVGVARLDRPDRRHALDNVLVDTASEFTWMPRNVLDELGVASVGIESFRTADGWMIERQLGFALIDVGGRSTEALVVFAESGDTVILGAYALEDMSLRVNFVRGELLAVPEETAAA